MNKSIHFLLFISLFLFQSVCTFSLENPLQESFSVLLHEKLVSAPGKNIQNLRIHYAEQLIRLMKKIETSEVSLADMSLESTEALENLVTELAREMVQIKTGSLISSLPQEKKDISEEKALPSLQVIIKPVSSTVNSDSISLEDEKIKKLKFLSLLKTIRKVHSLAEE